MAVITNTSLAAVGQIVPTSILLATSGDTLTYNAGTNQILILQNSDASSINVTIDGDGGSTVVVPNTGGTTASVASGKVFAVAAGATNVVRLDTMSAFLQGNVSIVAATGAKVSACIVY